MSQTDTLLVVDDDEEISCQMKWALADEYHVFTAADAAGALEVFQNEQPPVLLLDLGLPPRADEPTEGLNLLSELLTRNRNAKVIIITGQSEKENALCAVGAGAFDFLCKPIQLDDLRVILKRAFYLAHLEQDYQEMQRRIATDQFEGMLGASPQIQQVFSSIKRVADSQAPVLILGESGTGKEMAALAIHRRSRRKEGPFVAINCGAIPENLLESELFGHEKGAFTGAHAQRQGRIEAAAGGTLFLDEIGELSLALQVKLLRFLQEQTIDRVGGRKGIRIDSRVIAATNSDLQKAMEEGGFREDLYYRLAVVVVKMPPLRERVDDVPLLAEAFLRRFSQENGKKTTSFNSQALRALRQHSWPGNVRELENRVKRAVIMADGKQVTAADLELSDAAVAGVGCNLKAARAAVEKELLEQALRKYRGKISPAAAELGISRPTFYELMEKLGINKDKNSK